MRTDDLDYDLPPGLIAQTAAEPRDSARLLVYDRAAGAVRHRHFRDLLDELDPGDLVVLNNTRVLPVRVRARRATGGAAEVLLLEPQPDGSWEALARPARRLRDGETVTTGELEITIERHLDEGRVLLRPHVTGPGPIAAALERVGEMPLPPYIHEQPADPQRYQTVYARHPGSAAAPTAGLHFTSELLDDLRARHEVVEVTLGVGLDTFRPATEADLDDHPMHSEAYAVTEAAADAIDAARRTNRRIVAVGTTTVRVLETVWREPERGPLEGRTRLLIEPGHEFRAVGALVTNFHLPRSTLLALVMAFAGTDETRGLYRTAVEEKYRFYSFGDAMLLL
ncbi:MAG TPA: tRNA preQ1(34) S-adenosylmethionine ribosyltransferase-isomerase QueA [Gaiellales bacterium]|nr:tRNA preQ1(34) S-adenosylmethionine ribosyltransferase-isomerase QueA [Gaiellales bacterium]